MEGRYLNGLGSCITWILILAFAFVVYMWEEERNAKRG